MKKLFLKIKLFFISLAWGMRGADKVIASSNKEADSSDLAGIEQHKETESVYADLLRGEVTQAVKELRHEMYYADRLANEYKYAGGGRVVKKNSMFSNFGKIEQSDGFPVQIIQFNKEDMQSLADFGVYNTGTDTYITGAAEGDMRTKDSRHFTIQIERDFLCSFRIEQYASKVVVKRIDDNTVYLDLYVSNMRRQFDNTHKLFLKSMEKIYMGDTRSDIIQISKLGFTTQKAYGSPDLKRFEYDNIKFVDIIDFEGNYVLRFKANILHDGIDYVEEFYDAVADEKSRNHERRENSELNLGNVIDIRQEEEYNVEEAEKLIEELNDGK